MQSDNIPHECSLPPSLNLSQGAGQTNQGFRPDALVSDPALLISLIPPTKAATAMDDWRTGELGVQRRTIGANGIFRRDCCG